jgi:hypothetical protein
LSEMLGEPVVGNAARLFEARDAFPNFHVDPAVGVGEFAKVILGNDLVREHLEVHFHVLILGHWCAVIEILDVCTGKSSTGGGDGTVKEEFGRHETGALGGGWAWVI